MQIIPKPDPRPFAEVFDVGKEMQNLHAHTKKEDTISNDQEKTSDKEVIEFFEEEKVIDDLLQQAEEGKDNSLFDESHSTDYQNSKQTPVKPEQASVVDSLTTEQLFNLGVFHP